MSEPLSVAPSWVLTTLRWLQSKHHLHGLSKDPSAQLRRALVKLKFRYVELVEMSEKPLTKADKDWKFTLENQVSVWDEECHRQLREFLDDGGYAAESGKAEAAVKASEEKIKASGGRFLLPLHKWNAWRGVGSPIFEGDVEIDVKARDGRTELAITEPTMIKGWDHRGVFSGSDIIEFRVKKGRVYVPDPAMPDQELEKVERDLRPASAHAPEQELQAAVEQERLVRDPRLGAW